jgi:ABC-type lipoprotein export system ATPase subunit
MIELHHISKTYYSYRRGSFQQKALHDISLSLPSKGLVFVVGKSGSGKSTLLNIVGGLDKPEKGYLLVDGKDSRAFKEKDWDRYRADCIGFVFQEYNLINELSVGDNVALACKFRFGEDNCRAKAQEALSSVGLEGFFNRRPTELSGGERQRVAIARALAKDPEAVLADEPTGALDSETAKQIFSLLRKIADSRLVVVVTHDLDFAKELGDRIITLKDGAIVFDEQRREEPAASASLIPTGLSASSFKHRLGFGSVFHLSLTYLSSKPLRLALTLLLSLTAFGFFGLADTLSSYDEVTVAANSLKESGDSLLSLEKNGEGHNLLTPEDLASVSAKTKVDFQGLNQTEQIWFSEEIPSESRALYDRLSSFYNPYTSGFIGLQAGGLLPSDCHLIAGSLPSRGDEVALTAYQYGLFEAMGYRNPIPSIDETISVEDISMDKMIGKPLYYSISGSIGGYYYISGFVDAGFDESKYEHYKNYLLGYSSAEDDETAIQRQELKDYLSSSIDTAVFVTEDQMKTIEETPLSYPLKDDVSSFISLESPIMVFSPYSLMAYSEGDENAFLFDQNQTTLADNQFIAPFESYCDAAARSYGSEAKEFTIYGEYRSNGEEETVVLPPYSFFVSLSGYAIDYISEKDYSEAYANSEFDVETYADEYYATIGSANPGISAIPEEDKPKIFELFIRDTWNNDYLLLSSEPARMYHALSFALAKQMIQRYVADYKASYFSADSFSVASSKDGTSGIQLQLVGFTVGNQDHNSCLASKTQVSSLCQDVDGFYRRAFAEMPSDVALVRNAVSLNYTSEAGWAGKFYVSNSVLSPITDITSKVTLFSALFWIASIVLAIFACVLLFNYLSVSISDKRSEIGILRSLGAGQRDVLMIFYLESVMISVISSLLSYVILFAGSSLINDSLAKSFGIMVTLMMAGPRQVALVFALSLFVATLSTLFPIIKITRESPVYSISDK